MVGDQCPSIAGILGPNQEISLTFKKIFAIGITEQNPTPGDSSADHMMDSTGCIDSAFSRHALYYQIQAYAYKKPIK